jgi:hypothetical protein
MVLSMMIMMMTMMMVVMTLVVESLVTGRAGRRGVESHRHHLRRNRHGREVA